MKNKKLTVTVGIPVYNEEKNIKFLLKSIFQQKENNFTLQKIIIVSDACTDKTEKIIESFKNSEKLITVINKKRLGQSSAQNQIIKLTSSDILILLEADTLPENSSFIENLIKPIINNKTIALVQGNEKPEAAKSFIGKVISLQFTIYHDELIKHGTLRYWFTSGRGGRALSKSLYKKFRWLSNVPEDVYLHLTCKNRNYLTEFSVDAICRYKSPETFKDIKKEIKKVGAGSFAIFEYFPKTLVDQMYNKSLFFRIKCAFNFLQKNPLYLLAYIVLSFMIFKDNKVFSDLLPVAKTTKQLYEKKE